MNLDPRKPGDSAARFMHIVRAEDLNMHGSLFGGKMVAYMDTCAAIAAFRHTNRNCVTAKIADVSFLAPVRMGHILDMTATVVFAASTSMEVHCEAFREEHISGDRKKVCEASFTFVAVDEEMQPVRVPPVEPDSEVARQRYAEAKRRYELRKAERVTQRQTPR